MRNTFVLCCGLLATSVATAQSMPNVRPVPGSGAAYLYFPGETEGRVKLSITKEFGNTVMDRYAVYYRQKDKREVLVCGVDEEQCEKLLPAGQGRLRIEGFYDPAKKLPITHAKFGGACSAVGKQCNLNLRTNTAGSDTVRITTGCNARDYSVVDMGGKNGQVLCVGYSLTDSNAFLLAAHQRIATKRVKKQEKVGFVSKTDGKANTRIMLDNWGAGLLSESAAHYCQRLTVGENKTRLTEWYVPAINELDMALAGWEGAGQSFIIPKDTTGYYSSTETGNRSTETFEWNNSKNRSYLNYANSGSILCMYSLAM